MEHRSRAEMAAVPGVGPELSSALFEMGWRSVRELAIADTDELAQVVGSVELAEQIIETANDAASGNLVLDVQYPQLDEESGEAAGEELER